ncbi:MAG: exodeoxyribonuclease V subunit alpha [Verrucomicrobiales bacterium]|nr:exodeoxyribonuclease V subunit alpha [Verrucomicrobiales bacterium]
MNASEVESLLAAPPFAGLDAEFAGLMERLSGAPNPALRLAAALVSRRRSEGEVCLDLVRVAGEVVENDAGHRGRTPSLAEWIPALQACPAVVGNPGSRRPLILDGTRLYWQRYWDYEHRLATMLSVRAAEPAISVEVPQRVTTLLAKLFPGTSPQTPDWQTVAAFLAFRNRLTVLLGGPGTGKTRTVSRALALLLALEGPALRVSVTAPTGKAAARLRSAIRHAKQELAETVPAMAGLDDEVRTIHRLLRIHPETGVPRFDARNPLAADVLVVDEASMVDLALMTKLVAALPGTSRLILIGDRNQLAAVEAGSVLGDLAPAGGGNRFSPAVCDGIFAATGIRVQEAEPGVPALADRCVELQASHRFGEGSAIQRASRCVNAGDASGALAVLQEATTSKPAGDDACWQTLPARDRLREALRSVVLAGFGPLFQTTDPRSALAAMDGFRILTAIRAGPYGVEGMNQVITELLRESGWIRGETWYAGRQVLVTANDPESGLFNGDLGVVLPDPEGRLAVWFSDPDGTPRRVSPARLPPHETAFALTVHKSQGSEFDEVLLVLPERPSRVVTRELVYTGLTRARRRAVLWSRESVFRDAVYRRIERASGLWDRLWERS